MMSWSDLATAGLARSGSGAVSFGNRRPQDQWGHDQLEEVPVSPSDAAGKPEFMMQGRAELISSP